MPNAFKAKIFIKGYKSSTKESGMQFLFYKIRKTLHIEVKIVGEHCHRHHREKSRLRAEPALLWMEWTHPKRMSTHSIRQKPTSRA